MKKLYLSNWNVNATKILDEIDRQVKELGGEPASQIGFEEYYFAKEPIEVEAKDGSTFISKHADVFGVYTKFVIGNMYYYIELDDNPFMDFYFTKANRDYKWNNRYGAILPKNLFKYNEFQLYTDEQIKETAKAILDWAFEARENNICRDDKRVFGKLITESEWKAKQKEVK